METKGVLDRLTNDLYGTIIAEDFGEEFVLNKTDLPAGSKEGTWFNLVIVNGELESLTINHELTHSRKVTIEEKMAKLKKRANSKFEK